MPSKKAKFRKSRGRAASPSLETVAESEEDKGTVSAEEQSAEDLSLSQEKSQGKVGKLKPLKKEKSKDSVGAANMPAKESMAGLVGRLSPLSLRKKKGQTKSKLQ
eukprot:1773103-Rhodomonas_salina.3